MTDQIVFTLTSNLLLVMSTFYCFLFQQCKLRENVLRKLLCIVFTYVKYLYIFTISSWEDLATSTTTKDLSTIHCTYVNKLNLYRDMTEPIRSDQPKPLLILPFKLARLSFERPTCSVDSETMSSPKPLSLYRLVALWSVHDETWSADPELHHAHYDSLNRCVSSFRETHGL